MTLEEFDVLQPRLAKELRSYVDAGVHSIIEGVYQRNDGLWEAHVVSYANPIIDIVTEARCKPGCRRGIDKPYVWHYEDHVCCMHCEVDPQHFYDTCHE